MTRIRTHNNRRRRAAMSYRQREWERAFHVRRQFRRRFRMLKKWLKAQNLTITGRPIASLRGPEPQYINPNHRAIGRAVDMVTPTDWSGIEERVSKFYEEASKATGLTKEEARRNIFGMAYGMGQKVATRQHMERMEKK